MPWLGVWFEPEADKDYSRSPEWFEALAAPVIYPYAHSFIEAENQRLQLSRGDPSSVRRDGERYSVYYSLNHDGGDGGLDRQGCSILQWLFANFARESGKKVSLRFSEIPVVIHDADPSRAAALGNALALLRFLGAGEDQAIAKILLWPWDPRRGGPRRASREYEKTVLAFLKGEIFYPDDVTLFDVLERRDLRSHRGLAPCCETQIGFIRPLLEWIDESWPATPEEGAELQKKLGRSLADEAVYVAKSQRAQQRQRPRDELPQGWV